MLSGVSSALLVRPKLTLKMSSSLCSRLLKTPRPTLNSMSSCRGLSGSIVLMTRVNPRGGCTGSSLPLGCGIQSSLHLTATGKSSSASRVHADMQDLLHVRQYGQFEWFQAVSWFQSVPCSVIESKLTYRHIRPTPTLW